MYQGMPHAGGDGLSGLPFWHPRRRQDSMLNDRRPRRPSGPAQQMPAMSEQELFPGMVRDREGMSQLWTHVAEVLSDGVRNRALMGEDGQQASPAGLPPVSEWAGMDGRVRAEPDMMDASGYRYSDEEIRQFAPEGMPRRDTLARDFRIGDNQIAELALGAGFDEEQAVIAVAVALAESGGSTAAVGDAALMNRKWGSSLGLWQIRSLHDPARWGSRTDLMRDSSRLFDPQFNAEAAFAISGQGTNWDPWTVYKNGSYRRYLGRARQAVRDAGGLR